MFKHNVCISSIIAGSIFLSFPQTSWTKDFTSADLMAQGADSQASFIDISVTMAGAIAANSRPEVARCLNDWYFKDTAIQDRRKEAIREAMRTYPEYHPSAVILGVLQKACGSFRP